MHVCVCVGCGVGGGGVMCVCGGGVGMCGVGCHVVWIDVSTIEYNKYVRYILFDTWYGDYVPYIVVYCKSRIFCYKPCSL